MNGNVLDFLTVNAVAGVLLPLLTQLLVHLHASSRVKVLVNSLLSAAVGAASPYVTLSHVPWMTVVVSVVSTFVISNVAHLGLLSGLGVTGSHGLNLGLSLGQPPTPVPSPAISAPPSVK